MTTTTHKPMRRGLTMLLTLVFVLTLVPVLGLTANAAWDGASADTRWYTYAPDGTAEFIIRTEAQLAGLSEIVNGGEKFSGKKITLANDLDLDGHPWTPIANFSNKGSGSFEGHFDGDGRSIIGLSVGSTTDPSGNDYNALFGILGEDGVISNLSVSGAVHGGWGSGTGILVGGNNGNITNCHAAGTVSGGVNSNNGGLVGGNSGDITNCSAIVNVSGGDLCGGLVGSSAGSVTNCFAAGTVSGSARFKGGLVASNSGGTITSGYFNSDANSPGGAGTGMPLADMTSDTFKDLLQNYVYNYTGGLELHGWARDAGVNDGLPYVAITPADHQSVPTMPLNFLAIADIGKATVTWEPPADDGGNAIISYQVMKNDDTDWTNTAGADTTSHTFENLAGGAEYTFYVRAVNDNGAGAESEVKATVALPATPTLTANSGNPSKVYTSTAGVKLDLGGIDAGASVTLEMKRGNNSYADSGLTITVSGEVDISPLLTYTGIYTFRAKQTVNGAESAYSNEVEITVSSSGSSSGSGTTTYTVKFESNGGSSVSSQSVTRNGKATEPAAPTRDGYEFTGWYTDAELTTKYDFAKAVTSSFTLYAGWEEITVTDPEPHIDHPAYIQGYADGTFRPDSALTRAEAATLIYNIVGNGIMVTSYVPDYDDVPRDLWCYGAVMELTRRGVLTGDGNGIFRPNDTVTRAEFAAMALRMAGDSDGETKVADLTDVAGSHWAIDYITGAVQRGYITGYPDGTFRPDAAITRAESVTVLNRVIGCNGLTSGSSFTDVPGTHWAYEAITAAATGHLH